MNQPIAEFDPVTQARNTFQRPRRYMPRASTSKAAWWRFCCGICALSLTAVAVAQPFPSRPVRFIVPFAPGGGTDLVARKLGQKLTEIWGQQIVVDNRPSAGGNSAAETTARAAPDGYTIFQINSANAIAVSLYKKLNYDPVKDFAAVTQLATVHFMLVVHSSVRAKTTQELIALATAEPGKLNYASSGNGGSSHLVTEMFRAMSNINIVHIPYSSGGQALSSVLSGQTQILFSTPAVALPHVKAGRVNVLGMTSLKRSAVAPNVPTIAESGVPGFEGGSWYGVVVPARTPRTVVSKLHHDIVEILQQLEIRDWMSSQAIEVVGSTPEQFAQFLNTEIAKWRRAVELSGARAD